MVLHEQQQYVVSKFVHPLGLDSRSGWMGFSDLFKSVRAELDVAVFSFSRACFGSLHYKSTQGPGHRQGLNLQGPGLDLQGLKSGPQVSLRTRINIHPGIQVPQTGDQENDSMKLLPNS